MRIVAIVVLIVIGVLFLRDYIGQADTDAYSYDEGTYSTDVK